MAYRTEIEKLEQRYAENPKQWFAALADAYRKQGDVDLAIEYVKSGIDERPDYASAHIVLGRCYLDKNMDDDAARSFEEVLELDAENIIALKSLAEIAERKSDLGGARHWINRLLEVDPMNEEAHECLVRLESAETAAQPQPEVEAPQTPVPPMQEESPQVESPVEPLAEAAPTTGTEYPSEAFSEPPQSTMEPAGVEPIGLEQADTGTESPIEPIELEATEADASSLLAGVPEEDDTAPQDFDTAPAIEPIELESADLGADSLLAGLPMETEPTFGDDEPSSPIEPIELESTEMGADSLLAGLPTETEPTEEEVTAPIEAPEFGSDDTEGTTQPSDLFWADVSDAEDALPHAEMSEGGDVSLSADEPEPEVFPSEEPAATAEASEPEGVDEGEGALIDEGAAGIEAPEVDWDTESALEIESQRLSVPPTTEVEAADLEAMRTADEAAAGPKLDDVAVGDQQAESPATAQIDASELNRLREEDALQATTPAEELPETGVPEAEVTEDAVREAAMPEAEVDEAAVPEAGMPEAEVDEAAVPEAGMPEAEVDEAAVPEAGMPEADVDEAAVPEAGVPELETPEEETSLQRVPEAEQFETVDLAASAESSDMEIPEGEDLGVIPFDEDLGWGTAGEESIPVAQDDVEGTNVEAQGDLVSPIEYVAGTPEVESDSVFFEESYEEGAIQDVQAQDDSESLTLEEQPADVLAGGPGAETETESFAEMGGDEESSALPLILPEDSAEAEATTQPEPEPVVTETMAEVYANQGLLDQAREIYEVLVMQHSDDARLRARLEQLTEQVESAAQATRQSRFSVRATGGESAVDFLRNIFSRSVTETPETRAAVEEQAPDTAYAAPERETSEAELPLEAAGHELASDGVPEQPGLLAAESEQAVESSADQPAMEMVAEESEQETTAELPAIETVGKSSEVEEATEECEPEPEPESPTQTSDREPTPIEEAFSEEVSDALGEPTVPASDEVNLESVFDGPAPHAGPPPTGEADSTTASADGGVSFDEFYGKDASESSPETDSTSEEDEPTDDDDFKRWLEGLKT